MAAAPPALAAVPHFTAADSESDSEEWSDYDDEYKENYREATPFSDEFATNFLEYIKQYPWQFAACHKYKKWQMEEEEHEQEHAASIKKRFQRCWLYRPTFTELKWIFLRTPAELAQQATMKKWGIPAKPRWHEGYRDLSFMKAPPPPGMIRVLWYPSVEAMVPERDHAVPDLWTIVRLQKDGSLDLGEISKLWNMEKCVAVDYATFRVHKPRKTGRLSPMAVHLLTSQWNGTLRVVEMASWETLLGRKRRQDISDSQEFLRMLPYNSPRYARTGVRWLKTKTYEDWLSTKTKARRQWRRVKWAACRYQMAANEAAQAAFKWTVLLVGKIVLAIIYLSFRRVCYALYLFWQASKRTIQLGWQASQSALRLGWQASKHALSTSWSALVAASHVEYTAVRGDRKWTMLIVFPLALYMVFVASPQVKIYAGIAWGVSASFTLCHMGWLAVLRAGRGDPTAREQALGETLWWKAMVALKVHVLVPSLRGVSDEVHDLQGWGDWFAYVVALLGIALLAWF